MQRKMNSLFLATVLSFNVFAAGKNITTKELTAKINDPKVVVVDTRLPDQFSGWDLGDGKGGHIKGATDFSAQWLKVEGDKNLIKKTLLETLKNKKITPEKEVVLYDSTGTESKEVAKFLESNGYKNVNFYNLKDFNSSLVKIPNFQMLVPAKEASRLIKEGYKVFEVAWGPEDQDKDYLSGHLPGAVHIDTDEIEHPPLWSINDDAKLMTFAKNNGITKDDKIVLYSSNPMPSYRLALILTYLGVKDVRVLNGGLPSWKMAGLPLETKRNPKVPNANGFGAATPINKSLITDIAGAKVAAKSGTLIDIRSYEEHIGKITGYSDLKYKGRPAGAIWGKAGSDPNQLEEYRNIDNTMRNGEEILAMWKSLGIDTNKELTFFCGSGWRAAEVTIFAKVLGLKNPRLYSNGWYEWSADKNNPTEMGVPKSK